MGPSQQWARLGSGAMRDMLAPLGIKNIRIDPHPARELEVPAVPRGLGLARQDFELNAVPAVTHAESRR